MGRPDLEVAPVSDHEWRVCDARIAQDDAGRVLGFVEQSRAGYEALRIDDGIRFKVFPTLEDALGHFLAPPRGS